MKTNSKFNPWKFLIIPLILYFIWVVIPTIYSLYLSFTEYDGLVDPEFIGLENYQELFQDSVFYTSLLNNLRWIIVFLVIPVTLGLFLAIALNKSIKGSKIFKSIIYSPMVLAPVVIGLIWSWIYSPRSGLLNHTLSLIGLGNLVRPWLSDPQVAIYAIIGAGVWRHTGYVMIIYLAGLTSISPELVEAAKIDGAGPWQRFRYVILPLLKPTTTIVLVITMVESLRAFDFVNIMTDGGPYHSTEVLANFMYKEAFGKYNMGYGASIAVILFLIMAVFIFMYVNYVREKEGGNGPA
ncbi:MAG: carbohydrate ABC transporter permease [Halanaerobiales bacterium]